MSWVFFNTALIAYRTQDMAYFGDLVHIRADETPVYTMGFLTKCI